MYLFLIVVLASYFNVNYHFLFGLKFFISKWNYDDISAYLILVYEDIYEDIKFPDCVQFLLMGAFLERFLGFYLAVGSEQ